MKAAKDTVGPEAGLVPVAGARPGLAAVLVPEAASLTPGPGVGAVASLVQLVGLQCLRRARNEVLLVDQNLQHLWIGRGLGQGPDPLTVEIELYK